jgi:hypothetical protein
MACCAPPREAWRFNAHQPSSAMHAGMAHIASPACHDCIARLTHGLRLAPSPPPPMIDAGIVAALCGMLSAAHKRRLRAHVRSEEKALRSGTIEESVRLAGQSHVLLTELAGGTELLGLVGQLVAKTELYKALFDPSKGSACSADEHAHIIDALDAGDLAAALAAMREHLSELEERVVEQVRKSAAGESLDAVFGL